MRTIEETRKRWETLFLGNTNPSDLRAALRGEQGANLCRDGLRSICWKVFLLFDNVDRENWSQKLAESREAYSALRGHFLKYIEHPNDLESTMDPLADDEESPWQTLRNDEQLRAEISQDVDRCMQENHFFQEPVTKTKLTDILFVYSKLNPDVGYRQGMHELVAPILWVVDRDSIQRPINSPAQTSVDSDDGLMLDLLDSEFIEHDSFTLFLSVMQTARIYYEHGETKSANGQMDVIPIVNRCQYLHQEALSIIDHELAEHLETVDVLPQIFLTRWMRLLFGREFPFDDVLMMWDLLFAHGLRSDLVDFTCIAMLLRIRWPLLKADYSSALSMLLRYPSPEPHAPSTFMHDALYLEQNPTAERGSFIISKYSGRPPESFKRRSQSGVRPAMKAHLWEDFKSRSESNSSTSSPARGSPKSLEALLQDVSQGIQRRTESWGVAKAVRGAVTEARRNMQTMHYEPGLRGTTLHPKPSSTMGTKAAPNRPTATELGLQSKITRLEERNKALAIALGDSLQDLRSQLAVATGSDGSPGVTQALDQAESVRRCLEDSMLPMLPSPVAPVPHARVENDPQAAPPPEADAENVCRPEDEKVAEPDPQDGRVSSPADSSGPSPGGTSRPVSLVTAHGRPPNGEAARAPVRPSLSDAGFSWMLEGSRNLSSFVSSVSAPPEQTRYLEQQQQQQPQQQPSPRSKGSRAHPLFGNGGDEYPSIHAEHNELAMHNLQGARGPL